jgi:hypothetical protein
MTPARTILCGGLIMGSLDILKNMVFLSYQGRPVTWVLHAVASGALGRSAFEGGLPVAALGLALHFFIAFSVFTVYYLASLKLPILTRHAYVLGALYGVAVFAFMRFVVFPLSAIGPVKTPLPVLIDGVLTHIFCVGLPTGIIVREAARRNGWS